MLRTPITAILAAGCLSSSPTITAAETITVCVDGCDFTSVNAAIDAAEDGDVIQLAAETYLEGSPIDTNGKAITIRGTIDKAGDPASTLDGGGSHGVLECSSGEGADTIFEDLVIRHGNALFGAGMLNTNGSSPTLRNCLFTGNAGSVGGGMAIISHGNPTLTDCLFVDNSADQDGGGGIAIVGDCHPILTNCRFIGNSAGTDGGGILFVAKCEATIVGCSFTENTATRAGGGVAISADSVAVLDDCIFTDNSAVIQGGGLSVRATPEKEDTTLSDCLFTGNEAFSGGAIYHEACTPTLTGCRFTANAADFGGAITNLEASPRLENCTFLGNTATSDGAALYGVTGQGSDPSIPALTDCTFIDNRPGTVSSDFITPSTTCVPGDLDGDGDYDETDARLAMADFGIIEGGDMIPGDADGDGDVDIDDRTAVNDALGLCAADIDGNGEVDGFDMAYILSFWGSCVAP